MKTVMIGKQKGGVGATTAAREIAVAAAADGLRVVLVDLDPQASLSKWWSRRTADAGDSPNPGLATPTPMGLPDALTSLASARVDLVVIDAPPSVHPFIGEVMRHTDFVLVPTGPTIDDLEALPPVLDLIDAAGKPFAFVLTRIPSRSRMADEATVQLAQRARVAPPFYQRTDYPAAAARGSSGFEIGAKTRDDVTAFWEWLRVALAIKKRKR